MATAFSRKLGKEAGVQLNPLGDNSNIAAQGNSDQFFGIPMRATRGRIDKPFLVTRGDLSKKLGKGESLLASALNEAYIHVYEALNTGAKGAVVQRLSVATAAISYIVARVAVNNIVFTAEATAPLDAHIFSLKHLGCHNDGIIIECHADENRVSGVNAANSDINIVIKDSDGLVLFDLSGSLDSASTDDYGNTKYLPNVVASLTDEVEITVGSVTSIADTSTAYGFDANGQEQWAVSSTLIAFDEVGTGYVTADYVAAREKLQFTPIDYAYISSGGSKSSAVIAQLAQLSYDTNKQFRFDIDGSLTPDAAITFYEQLNIGASKAAHLIHAYWSPLKSDDPTGLNGNAMIGFATMNIAYACGRNARKNAKGFAPKQYVIAGKDYPISRTGIKQIYQPKDSEFSQLAAARINPCVFDFFSSGGFFIFKDSLTGALVDNGLKKLISVAEMSSSIDDAATRYAKDSLQLPLDVAVKRTNEFLLNLLESAESSGWLVPSSDPAMGGASFKVVVQANAIRPYDSIDIGYWVRYTGTARQFFVTQTLTR